MVFSNIVVQKNTDRIIFKNKDFAIHLVTYILISILNQFDETKLFSSLHHLIPVVVYECIDVKQHKIKPNNENNNGFKSILIIGKHLENDLLTPRPAKIGLSFIEKGPSRVTGASVACGQGCE